MGSSATTMPLCVKPGCPGVFDAHALERLAFMENACAFVIGAKVQAAEEEALHLRRFTHILLSADPREEMRMHLLDMAERVLAGIDFGNTEEEVCRQVAALRRTVLAPVPQDILREALARPGRNVMWDPQTFAAVLRDLDGA